MKLLFFTHTRLGDAVLSTGVIRHYVALHPDIEITVVCSPLVAGIFAAMPNVVRVVAVKKQKYSKHWWDVWRQVRSTRWDIVVDLRNSLVSRTVRAGRRYIWRKMPQDRHKVEQIASVIAAAPAPAPRLWFDAATVAKAADFLKGVPQPRIVIAPVANWIGKTWPAERFIELIDRLAHAVDPPMPDARFIIMAGPGEEEVAKRVLAACPQGYGFDAIARFSPLEAAAVIARCDAFIGNDSGLMHCAAATGIPTLGLFGPSNRAVYRPWGAQARMVETPESFAEIQALPGYAPDAKQSFMTSLGVDRVYAAFKNMLDGESAV